MSYGVQSLFRNVGQGGVFLSIDSKLAEAKLQSGFLQYVDSAFKFSTLSDPIKWQVYYASQGYRDSFGNIHLNDELPFTHLSRADLVLLFKIYFAYHHEVEIYVKGKEQAIFSKPIQQIEDHFLLTARTDVIEGQLLFQELKKLELFLLTPFLQKLLDVLKERKKTCPPQDVIAAHIQKAMGGADGFPNAALLWHAKMYFNLDDNPAYPILSNEVKWQLLHAAGSFKDKDGVVHLSDNFRLENLDLESLVALYRILLSYHRVEKEEKGEKDTLFDKHLLAIEIYFEFPVFLRGEEPASVFSEALLKPQDPILFPMVRTIEMIVRQRGRYPVFKENPEISNLAEIAERGEVAQTFHQAGIESVVTTLTLLERNYKDLTVWLNEFSLVEASEQPDFKTTAFRIKSIVHHVYNERYIELVTRIGNQYPVLFGDKLSLGHGLALRPGGMNLMIEKFKRQGSFQGNVCICDNYEIYKQGLRNLAEVGDTEWYFVIRTHKVEWQFDTDHQALVFVEKKGGEFYVHIFDSGPFKLNLGAHQLAIITKSTLGQANVLALLSLRQRDYVNCSVFALNDMKAIFRRKDLIQWQRAVSKEARGYLPEEASEDTKKVQVLVDLPLVYAKPAQSISQVRAVIKSGLPIHDQAQITKQENLLRKYTLLELEDAKATFGSSVYKYASVKGLKYRISILRETFASLQAI